jgi:hypothetical protein
MYQANENEELRTKISENLGIPFEQAVCRGCREEAGKPDFLGWNEPCNVCRCITRRKLDFCYECSDFPCDHLQPYADRASEVPHFPCDHLQPYADRASEVPHNTKVFNLCLIKRMGLESWAKAKARDVKHRYFKEKFKL